MLKINNLCFLLQLKFVDKYKFFYLMFSHIFVYFYYLRLIIYYFFFQLIKFIITKEVKNGSILMGIKD